MLTVHHLGLSQSDRIVWLCEELGIPYELVRYDREPSGMAPAAYRALHPMGTAPIITDGDLSLGESGAIIEYIIAKHGGGRLAVAADKPNFTDYLMWFHFANASMLPRTSLVLMLKRSGADMNPEMLAAMEARADHAFDQVEKRLGAAPYFAGSEFTAADIMMTFPLTTMRMFAPRDLTPYPNIRAYLQRIGNRAAYQTAMKKADPAIEPNLT